jgi:hypothetical protein
MGILYAAGILNINLRTYCPLPQEYPGIVKTSNITSETYRNVPITIGVWHRWSAEKLLSAVKALIKQVVSHLKSFLGMYFIFMFLPIIALMKHLNLQWSARLLRRNILLLRQKC